MSSVIRPGGPRRDQVVLRRTRPDLDRMALDNAQLYLTSAPSGGGITVVGGSGAYSVAAAGQVTSVSGSTATVSCEAPISKTVTGTNYTGRTLKVNDLVFVTGIIDGSTETYSVVSVYQGSGIPDFASPPPTAGGFPLPLTYYAYQSLSHSGTGNTNAKREGNVVCSLSSTIPKALVYKAYSQIADTNDESGLFYVNLLTGASGSITAPSTLFSLQDNTGSSFASSIVQPYQDGFAVYTASGNSDSGAQSGKFYVWNPSGSGSWVTVNTPTFASTANSVCGGGVGKDGRLWVVQSVSTNGLAITDTSYVGQTYNFYRWSYGSDPYNGTWNLVDSRVENVSVVGTSGTALTASVQFSLDGAVAAGYGTTVKSTGFQAVLDVTVKDYISIAVQNGINSSWKLDAERVVPVSNMVVQAVKSINQVDVYIKTPFGSTSVLSTGIPADTVDSPTAIMDSDGIINVATWKLDGAQKTLAFYRVTQYGYSTLVAESVPCLAASTSTSVFWTTFAAQAPCTSNDGSKYVIACLPNQSGLVYSSSASAPPTKSATEKPKWSLYLFEV